LTDQSHEASEDHGHADAITIVGIPTCDRPTSVIACIESYVENCRRHGRNPEFVITDDSADANSRNRTRAALQDIEKRSGVRIRYAGRPERRRFAEVLARESGIPAEIVDFGLAGDDRCGLSTGANRNSLLLDSVDALALSVDDDTLCQIATAPGGTDAPSSLSFFAGYDPTEFWFFPDRATATGSVSFIGNDVLGCHEAWLGHDMVGGNGSLQAGGRVAITLNGLVGDSGMASPRYYLTLSGASRDRLVTSQDAYRSAFRSREVLRTVRLPTLCATPFFMTTFFGFDNRSLLPPFFPVQRNADGIFGLVLQKCVEDSRTAFLPSVLLHAPPSPRLFEPDQAWTDARTMRMADVVIACIFGHEANRAGGTDATRLIELGRFLRELGSLKLRDFEAHVLMLQQYRTMAFITALQSQLQIHAGPDFWAKDVKRMVQQMLQGTSAGDMSVPRDMWHERDVDGVRRLVQELITRFGALLEAWPAMVDAARRLRANGYRATDPV
jgi:hypothetical protein